MASALFTAINMLTLHVDDFPKAVAFYRDTLGLEVKTLDETFGWVEFTLANGVNLGLHKDDCAPDGRRTGGTTGFFIMCEDAAKTEAELRARGVSVTQGATQLPYGTVVAFEAPDGNEFAFLQPASE